MKTLLVLAMSAFVIGIASCAPAELPLPQKAGGGAQVSWSFGFDNLTDLIRYSDSVVIGTVESVAEVVPMGGQPAETKHVDYMTKWLFRVERVLKGKETRKIIVNQSGSPDRPGSDIMDDPLFLPKERYLLFLRQTEQGTYFYFGPNARYLIWNNKVYSMNYILERGYHAPLGLNFFGVDLDEMIGQITEIVDSVQISFTQGAPRLRADVLRYSAGVTLVIDVILSTGENGPGKVTLSVDKASLPEGLDANLEQIEFTARPRGEYKSTLLITTSPELTPGSYKIPIEYDFAGVGRGSLTITFNVNPAEMP